MGRCPQCGAWNSMVEEIIAPPAKAVHSAGRGLTGASTPQRLNEIEGDAEERWALSIGEFARVLGGGIVPGSIVLVGGDPGIGKSTLMLQVALEMARTVEVLYISGEELERQIKMRAMRLQKDEQGEMPGGLLLVTETNLGAILEHINAIQPALVIVDSIQTTYMPELEFGAGSVTQVRECASRLRELAKSSGKAIFLIGHVTKEGTIAGPGCSSTL